MKNADGTDFVFEGSTVSTFDELLTSVEGKSGWRFQLGNINVGDATGSGQTLVTPSNTRNVTSPTAVGQLVVLTAFSPSEIACRPEGEGYLFAPHLRAGVAPPFAPLDTDSTNIFATEGGERANLGQYIGSGNFSSPQVVETSRGGTKVVTQSDTAEIGSFKLKTGSAKTSRQSWREVIEVY